MKTIDFSYFIERYIADEMDDTEKIWFLKEVEGNDKLRQEIDLRRKTEAILKNRDVMNLREKLNTIENTRKTKEKAPVSGHSAVKYAVFIFGILIIAGSLTLITGRKISSDEIIDRYYKPYDPPASSRSASGTFNTDYTLAVEYYKIHDFRNAAVYFSKVINDEPGNMPSTLMKGISDFEIQDYPEATNSFRKVIDNNNNLYIDHAQWYLALCYIRTGEEQKAKEQLLEVEKSGSIYKNDAKKILRRIK